MKTVAIVPSAGSGKRLGGKVKKPFVMLSGRPLIAHTLDRLNSCDSIDAIIIAAERPCVNKFKDIVKRFKFNKVIDVVIGGSTRFESVKNCLHRVTPAYDMVLIHDGARPFVEASVIKNSIVLAKRFGGCIVAVPENDTVKAVDKKLFIRKTLDRKQIFRAQTPQVFRRALIEKAYGVKGKRNVTDDASLVEFLGKKVKVLEGSYRNIKITTGEDLILAEAFLREA